MYAFISYQTNDKLVAARVKNVLAPIGITSFMAHEDINVSEEWRLKILDEIGKADLFVSIWSANYYQSWWCIQESGIAAFRSGVTCIPLSTDGSIPQGFAGHIQSTKIDPENIYLQNLLPGIIRHDLNFGIQLLIKSISGSRSYRGAEDNFQQILPYVNVLSDVQAKQLLEVSIKNDQVHHASQCASEYLPPLLSKHGHLLVQEDRKYLEEICSRYAPHG